MIWNTLIPKNWTPRSPENLDDLSDVWIIFIISCAFVALFWAGYQSFLARQRASKYLKEFSNLKCADDYDIKREDLLTDRSLPLLKPFNDLLIQVPKNSNSLDLELRRCSSSDDVFNTGNLAKGLIGSRLLMVIPGVLTGLGVLGTFVGLQIGIGSIDFEMTDPEKMKDSITPLIAGCSTAFATSVWGVGCSLVYTLVDKFFEFRALRKIHRLSDTADALIPRYLPEDSMLALHRSSANSDQTLSGLAVAIGDQMQTAIGKLGEKVSEAVQQSLGDNAKDLGAQSAELMSQALTNELKDLKSVMVDTSKGFRDDLQGSSNQLNQTLSGFVSILTGIEQTIGTSTKALDQAVGRLESQEQIVTELSQGATRLKETAAELAQLRDTFKDGAEKNVQAANAQERAAESNILVAEKFEVIGEKLPEVQTSLTDGSNMIASLGEPLNQLIESLSKTPEMFGAEMNSTIAGFETAISGINQTVLESQKATEQATERLIEHEKIVTELQDGSIRLKEAATEMASMKDSFIITSENNKLAATAQERAATTNDEVAVKFGAIGDTLPEVQQAISEGARIIATIGEPLLNLKDVLGETPKIFEGQATAQAERDAKRSSKLLEQTEKLAATVASASEKFAKVEALSVNLTTSSSSLERAGTALSNLATEIQTAATQHTKAAASSERAAIASERTADKFDPIPQSIEDLVTSLGDAGGEIESGAIAAKDVYVKLLDHQKMWFEGIESGLSAMRDRVNDILAAYGDSVEGETKRHMEQWTQAVEDSLSKFATQVNTLEGAIIDLTSEK